MSRHMVNYCIDKRKSLLREANRQHQEIVTIATNTAHASHMHNQLLYYNTMSPWHKTNKMNQQKRPIEDHGNAWGGVARVLA